MNREEILRYFKDKRILVAMGGWSSEREVSLKSGNKVYEALRSFDLNVERIDIKTSKDICSKLKKEEIDVVFNIIHGTPGEDGLLTGYLEMVGIPYTGSGPEASVVGMDKFFTKILLEYYNIPVPPWQIISNIDDINLAFPVIVKPLREGSSVGIELIKNRKDLDKVALLLKRYKKLLVEKFFTGINGTVGILIDRALPVLELDVVSKEFYDYDAKYTKGATRFIIPARIKEDIRERIKAIALKIHNIVGARGFSRVDFVTDREGNPFFLEINIVPGLTELSDLPFEARHAGISYNDLMLYILSSSLKEV